MPEEQTTNQEEAPVEEQGGYVIKDIFPIETARQNASNHLKSLHTKKFVNKIVNEIQKVAPFAKLLLITRLTTVLHTLTF